MYERDPHLPIDATLLKNQEKYENTKDDLHVITYRFLEPHKLTTDKIELAWQKQRMQYTTKPEITLDWQN